MPRISLILHNIRSTHNVGSLFRTAEGFGVERIICSGYTPYPTFPGDDRLPHIARKLTGQISKTALGAEALVPFDYVPSIDAWRETTTMPLIALEQDSSSVRLEDFRPPEKFALLLGEEVDGISSQLLRHCQHIVEIPMVGRKESFNVSVAAGVALYQLTHT